MTLFYIYARSLHCQHFLKSVIFQCYVFCFLSKIQAGALCLISMCYQERKKERLFTEQEFIVATVYCK